MNNGYVTDIGFADAIAFRHLTTDTNKVAVVGFHNRRMAIANSLSGIKSAKFSPEVYPPVNGVFTPALITVSTDHGAKLMIEWTSSPHEEAMICAAA